MPYVKSSYLDFSLYVNGNDYVPNMFKDCGFYQKHVNDWLMDNVKPGWIVYDIGAHIFEITEIAARLAGRQGKVYSFEPQANLIKNYVKTRDANDYRNASDIFVFPFGLGKENAVVPMTMVGNNTGGATIVPEFREYRKQEYGQVDHITKSITIKRADSIDLPQDVPNLIKIDIEGSEPDFWLGAPDFLKKAEHIIIEIGPYTPTWFFNELISNRTAYNLETGEPVSSVPDSGRQIDLIMTLNSSAGGSSAV